MHTGAASPQVYMRLHAVAHRCCHACSFLPQWVWLPTPQDRVDALVNDTVDFVVAGLGATTAREVRALVLGPEDGISHLPATWCRIWETGAP